MAGAVAAPDPLAVLARLRRGEGMEVELVHGLRVLPVDGRHGDEVGDVSELPLELRALAVIGALADPS